MMHVRIEFPLALYVQRHAKDTAACKMVAYPLLIVAFPRRIAPTQKTTSLLTSALLPLISCVEISA